MIGSWDLQVAIVGILKTAGIVDGRIFDFTPPATDYPAVQVGNTQATGFDVTGRSGTEEFCQIDIWDRANASGGQRGRKNVKMIADAIHGLLNGKNLEVENRSAAIATVRDFLTVGDPDVLTAHGVLTLKVSHFGPQET